MADQDESGYQGELVPCKFCGREFSPESHAKHEPHCPENLHRPEFDSGQFLKFF